MTFTLLSQSEPFGKIILQLAEQEGVTEDKILLTLKDINILGYDTPISVQLNVADIIGECLLARPSGTYLPYISTGLVPKLMGEAA